MSAVLLALRATLSGLITWLGAWLYVRSRDGFGEGDLPGFGLWCAILAIYMAALAFLARGWIAPRSRSRRVLLGLGIGFLLGALFAIALAVGFGPAIHGFSFPILWLCGLGGAVGLLAAWLPNQSPTPRTPRLVPFLAASAGMLGLVAVAPFALLLGSVYLWDRGRSEVYLLPEGFVGPVVVVYDQPTAPPIPKVDGSWTFRIPRSGVLVTSTSADDGWTNPSVYYEDSLGLIEPMVTSWSGPDSVRDTLQAYWLGVEYRGSTRLPYAAFGFAKPGDTDRVNARLKAVLDSLWPLYSRPNGA